MFMAPYHAPACYDQSALACISIGRPAGGARGHLSVLESTHEARTCREHCIIALPRSFRQP
jgi:hypothetical protein